MDDTQELFKDHNLPPSKHSTNFQDIPSKEYLTKDFGAELNYKLWVTKGAKYKASRRLEKLSKLSNLSLGLLTSYIIIINILILFPSHITFSLSPESTNLLTICLSIIILVFSQYENQKEYSLNSYKFHHSAQKISELYNEWRYIKSYAKDTVAMQNAILEITKKYQVILYQSENHSDIDLEMFKCEYKKYFGKGFSSILAIKLKYYIKVVLLYHLFLATPIFIYLILI